VYTKNIGDKIEGLHLLEITSEFTVFSIKHGGVMLWGEQNSILKYHTK